MQIQTDTEALEKYRDRNIETQTKKGLSETERNRKIRTVRQRQTVTKIGSLRQRLR